VGLDKRQYERHPVSIDVSVLHGEQRFEARSRDISLGGMFILTDRPLPYGTACKIELLLPALPTPAVIEATVRWSGEDGMGVQFGALRARETWAINQLIRL
jgi:hypothetical protein